MKSPMGNGKQTKRRRGKSHSNEGKVMHVCMALSRPLRAFTCIWLLFFTAISFEVCALMITHFTDGEAEAQRS